jgi:CHAT domain-containing protein
MTNSRQLQLAGSGQPLNDEELKLFNPLLRSWLFFAGANNIGNTANGEASNGVMTALEATSLNLTGTKLVVLSACETGLGDVRNGEGVYGLRRALVLAGAETQMISLWPIDDSATRDLMVGYYKLLKEGVGRGEALRRVQLNFLAGQMGQKKSAVRRAHPYYWASFIQSGEWGNLEGLRK